MTAKVVIVDYGLGNLASVKKSFSAAGAHAKISSHPRDLSSATHIVLPGQGAFGEGVENLEKRRLISALEEQVFKKKRPFLGICLGMQLLGKSSNEGGNHKGLGWLDGTVVKIAPNSSVRLPHIGGDDVTLSRPSSLTKEVKNGSDFYFAHSYILKLKRQNEVVARSSYGEIFPAIIELDNIRATLFHPEKSQDNGMRIISNFLKSS